MTIATNGRALAPLLALLGALLLPSCAAPLGLPEGYRDRVYEEPGDPGPTLEPATAPELDDAPMEELTVERARALALQRNHTVTAARAAVDAAVARIAEARAAFLPTASGTVTRSWNRESTLVSIPGGPSFQISPDRITQAQGNLSISLFAFGRDWEQLLAARADVTTEIFAERAVRQQLVFAVTETWFRCHEADSAVVVARDSLAAAEQQLQDARNIFDAGRATRDAVLTAQVNVLDRRQALLVAENAVRQTRRILNTLLSRTVDAPVSLAESPAFEAVVVDPKRLGALSREHSPALMSFRSQRQALEHRRESIERSFAPELSGNLGAAYSDFRQSSGFATNYTASLSLTWTPIQGGLRFGRLQEIHAVLARLREQEIQAILDLALDIEKTVQDLGELESQHALATEAVAAATENSRIISDRFRAGRTTSREVLDAQVTLSDSRNALNQAAFAHKVELARLEGLVGVAREHWDRDAAAPESGR